MNINLNSQQVTDYVAKHNTDRYTAMAAIAAKEYGITDEEMPQYFERFHQYMSNSWGVLASIYHALMNIILTAGFKKIEASKPAIQSPVQTINFSLN